MESIQRLGKYSDIPKITSLFYTACKNDLYIIARFPDEDTRKCDIKEMMKNFLQKYRNHLLIYGIRQDNSIMAFLIAFDYEKMRTQCPSDFIHIAKELPYFETVDSCAQVMSKTQIPILYTLCAVVHPAWQHKDLEQQLITHLTKEHTHDYILIDTPNTTYASICRTLGFFTIHHTMLHIPHIIWKPQHIAIVNAILEHTKEKCGKYVITYTERKTDKKYYYCNRMYSDMWTEYLYEARLFNTKEYAKKISDTLIYTHQYIEKVGNTHG